MESIDRFEFSQSSLQDFVDCPQRFYLRYLRRLAWPAMQAEPAIENERHMQRGQRFHRLAQQYLIGIPVERLSSIAQADEDEKLLPWWQNFCATIPPLLKGERHVEAFLSAPLDSARLVAVYDLVLVGEDGRLTIFDWKTSLKRPKSITLRTRLQTRVYLYLLTVAGKEFNRNRPVEPEQVQMIYWFTEAEQKPEIIPYSAEQFAADQRYLTSLAQEARRLAGQIENGCKPEEAFLCCDEENGCRYCVYRSLCERGEAAGDLSEDSSAFALEPDTAPDLGFTFDQIGEIEF